MSDISLEVFNRRPPQPLSKQRFGPKKVRKHRLALLRQGGGVLRKGKVTAPKAQTSCCLDKGVPWP